MQKVAKESSEGLPKMIDSETRIDSIEGIENGLEYKYTLVNQTRADLRTNDISLTERLKPNIIKSICSSPDMSIYVRNGAILKYIYNDKNGFLIESIIVDTKTDC
jgi:hypothetical protein